MNDLINNLRIAQNLVAPLALHLATEMDLHNDIIDPEIMSDELAYLRQAVEMLVKAGMPVPEVIPHVLARGGLE